MLVDVGAKHVKDELREGLFVVQGNKVVIADRFEHVLRVQLLREFL
jgi:hypothetical protein